MIRAFTVVSLVVVTGCSRSEPRWLGESLTLTDLQGRLVERMGSDGVVTDHAGRVTARYDSQTGTMTLTRLPGQTIDVRKSATIDDARTIDLREGPFTPFRIHVTEANEVRSQRITKDGFLEPGSTEHVTGRLDHYTDSRDGAYDLIVLLCALPFVEPPQEAPTAPPAIPDR